MRVFVRSLVAALLCVVGPVALTAQAQEATILGECGTEEEVGGPRSLIDDGTEVRALVVLVRFRDDDDGVAHPADQPYRGWPYWLQDENGDPILVGGKTVPADYEMLPRFAHALIAPSVAAITGSDSTMSAYFYEQSKAGPNGPAQFLLWGDVLPTNAQGEPIVHVTAHPNAWYYNDPSDPLDERRGYGYLTKEVLDSLVYRQGIDLGDYNLNPEDDDVVDQIYMFVRNETNGHSQGTSTLGYVSGTHLSGVPPGTGGNGSNGLWYPSPSGQADPSLPDSVLVHWYESGHYLFNDSSGNVHQPTYYGRMGAHEYGHDLWRGKITSVHMGSVEDNVVPSNEPPGGPLYYGPLLMGSSTREAATSTRKAPRRSRPTSGA